MIALTKSMMVSLTSSWPNMVSQQSFLSSNRVCGSSVGLGVVVVVVVVSFFFKFQFKFH